MLEKLPDAIGHALRGQRSGLDQTLFQRVDLRQGMGALEVRSLAFEDHAPLPSSYTADGAGTSPPLQWVGVPARADSVVVVVEDADSPTPHPLVHAILAGLPGEDGSLPEGAMNKADADPQAQLGRNSFLGVGWLPPDPPPGHGQHRYVFQVFALAPGATLPATPGREAVLQVLQEYAIASGCLIGTYERPDGSVREPAAATGMTGGVLPS
jgi:Raf kinase inhibitor-like YbhB/YbcL family protein